MSAATGVVRKNHLKPRSVRLAATDSPREERDAVPLGDRARGHRDARLIGADQRVHLLLGDQAQRLVLPGCRRALVVGEHDLDLGALQARQARAFGQRQIAELGMGVVDDVHAPLPSPPSRSSPALAALPLSG